MVTQQQTAPSKDFPIVCLGASAGGVKAYTELLDTIPPDSPIALVIVNHMRNTASLLPEILPRYTSLPVVVITDGLRIETNHVYVIPPNFDLVLCDNMFRLLAPVQAKGWPRVITRFLCSVAREWNGQIIAVILSGLDADGVEALRDVKAAGGITFAQNIETAEFPDMPWHAIETGCIDFVLPPAAIGRRLGNVRGPIRPSPHPS